MIDPIRPASSRPAQAADSTREAQLRKAAVDLQSVFMHQLVKAMRQTVPEDGLMTEGSGGEMFRSMLDEQHASLMSKRLQGGLVEAIYRQLAGQLGHPPSSGMSDESR